MVATEEVLIRISKNTVDAMATRSATATKANTRNRRGKPARSDASVAPDNPELEGLGTEALRELDATSRPEEPFASVPSRPVVKPTDSLETDSGNTSTPTWAGRSGRGGLPPLGLEDEVREEGRPSTPDRESMTMTM